MSLLEWLRLALRIGLREDEFWEMSLWEFTEHIEAFEDRRRMRHADSSYYTWWVMWAMGAVGEKSDIKSPNDINPYFRDSNPRRVTKRAATDLFKALDERFGSTPFPGKDKFKR